MTVTLTSCTFSSNTAYKSGGVLYLSNTATTSTVKFGGTSFATTTATTLDGGVFYLAAYISNYLEVKNSLVPANAVSSLSSSVAGQNGGAVYMNGATNTFQTDQFTTVTTSTTANSGGLAYMTGSDTQTITLVGGIITGTTATNSVGGLARLIGAITSVTVGTTSYSTTITGTTAGTHGGGFYLEATTSSTLDIVNAVITTMRANGKGGLAYFDGLSNTGNINGATTVISDATGTPSLTGGLFYMNGATSNYVEVKTSATINTVSTSSHGALFYMNGATQQLYLDNVAITGVSTASEGGVLFSSTQTTSLTLDFTQATLSAIKASSLGSIVSLRKGVTTPYLSFAIDHSLVACKADDMTKDLATVYGPIWANFFTAATPSSNIGGAFYFEAVTSASTIDSDLNTYKNCYTAGQGGIFSLPSGLTMTDDGSVFKQNAALQGGVIYCNGCSVTFTSSSFADLLSSYGSIGYFLNDAVATFTSTDKMQHGKAGGQGGGIYFGGSKSAGSRSPAVNPALTLQNCDSGVSVQYFEAKVSGGFIYTSNPDLVIQSTSCSYSHLVAGTSGGFVEGYSLTQLKVNTCPIDMINITASTTGSFITSAKSGLVFEVTSCNLYCEALPGTTLSALPGVVSQGSMFDLTLSASVTFSGNAYKNCKQSAAGGIVSLKQVSWFQDTSSTYENNAATLGGAIYLDQTSSTLDRVTFTNNWAQRGGSIYALNQQTLTLLDCKVTSSYASSMGGFMYGTEPGTQTVSIIVSTTSASYSTSQTYANIHSQGAGGMFYLDGPRVSLTLLGYASGNKLSISALSASTTGGWLHSVSMQDLSLTNVQMQNVISSGNGGVMYINKAATVSLTDTTIADVSATSLASKGGLAYIHSNANTLSTFQLSRVVATNVLSRQTGSILHSESATVTFTSSSSTYQCHSAAYSVPSDFDLAVPTATYGGAFYLLNAVKFTSTSNIYQWCYLGPKGGAFYLENTQLVETTNSQYTGNAALSGGAIHCQSCTGLDLKQATFTTHSAVDGGLITLVNSPTIVNLDYITVTNAYASDKGGMVHVTGGSSASTIYVKNTVAVSSDVLWTDLSSESHGGGFYIDHTDLNVAIQVATTVTNSQSVSGMGGFFYILNNKALSIINSEFLNVKAALSGSFFYSQATTLTLTVTSTIVDCTNQGVSAAFTDLSSNLNVPEYSRGGAFYIKDTPFETVVNQLTLRNCYTGDSGGAFSLVNTELKDTSSSYRYNGAVYGGAFYCKDCRLDLTTITFAHNEAFDGGTFFIEDLRSSGLTQTGITITNSKAYDDGGTFYVKGSTAQTIDISAISVTTTWAQSNGGMMYVDNPNQLILAADLAVDTSTAGDSGGVFYFANVATVTISKATTGSSFQTLYAPIKGSFLYSQAVNLLLHMTDASMQCDLTDLVYPTDTDPYLAISPTSATTRGGAFYVQDAVEVVNADNIYQNCYVCHKGAVFHVKNTPSVQDSNSDYLNNAAVQGGVIYADNSQVTLITVSITNSYATSGGVFYFYDTSPLTVSGSTFETSHAYSKGGIGYFEQLAGLTSASITAANSYSVIFQSTTSFNTHSSVYDGGSFYFDSEQVVAITFDTVASTDTQATDPTGSGGFTYISKVGPSAVFSILGSTFDTFNALTMASFLYSADDSVNFIITSSTFACTLADYAPGSYSQHLTATQGTMGGAFHIENSLLGVAMTGSHFSNCYNRRIGGIFTLKNTLLTDTGSEYFFNSADQGGVFYCEDCDITLSTGIAIRHNDAYQGAVFYDDGRMQLTVTNTPIYENKAMLHGAVLSVINSKSDTSLAQISFVQCNLIYNNIAGGKGAFAYFDNQYLSLEVSQSYVRNHTSLTRSAFLEAVNIQNLEILDTGISDSNAPITTVMHSVARTLNMVVKQSQIVCSLTYNDFEQVPYINKTDMPTYTHNAKFYLEAAVNVSMDTNLFRSCGTAAYGGVFWLTLGTPLYDAHSIFEFNAGANGGVFNVDGSRLELYDTTLQDNLAWRGGVIELKDYSYLKGHLVKIRRNTAYLSAGAIFVNTFSYLDLTQSEFSQNYAPENSAVEVLQSSLTMNLTFDDCLFSSNTAIKNTISLMYANVVFTNSQIYRNRAQYKSKHLFAGFSRVYLYDTQFKGASPTPDARTVSLTDETLGSHIYAIIDTHLFIKQCFFLEGISKFGGAVYLEGNSTADIIKSTFQNNYARRKGGAIYATGFNRVSISYQSKMLGNLAGEEGDDAFVVNTEGLFSVQDTQVVNPKASRSIQAENANVSLSMATFQNIGSQPVKPLAYGAALYCYNCRGLLIEKSTFSNLKAQEGGAVYVEESSGNKKSTDRYGKYRITGTTFDSCNAIAGGALLLRNPQYLTITGGTQFTNNYARNSSDDAFKAVRGSGAAIFFDCDSSRLDCLVDIGDTSFASNTAEIKGGAIHWDTVEPVWGLGTSGTQSIKYKGNKAGRYGDNISCFPQQIAIIDEKDWKSVIYQSTGSGSSDAFYGGRRLEEGQRETILRGDQWVQVNETTRKGRWIQEEVSPVDVNSAAKNVSFNTTKAVESQRSGGDIPQMYLGLVDKYGQIVTSDDSSSIQVMIDAFASQNNDTTEASKFPPFIEGTTDFKVQAGVVKVSNVAFAATPGYNYSLRFGSQAINPQKVAASAVMSSALSGQNSTIISNTSSLILTNSSLFLLQNLNSTLIASSLTTNLAPNFTDLEAEDLAVKVNITLRECEIGEQFQWNGKCNRCPTNTSFSLVKMDQPGECQSCPTDRAVCNGGSFMGPAAGFWRKSNWTSTFLSCLHKEACLGMIPPEYEPKGQCAEGYQGVMCADCEFGYTRSREWECTQCDSSKAWYSAKILLIILALAFIVYSLIIAQAKSRYLHVYLRQLIDHVQMVLLIATYNFNWPDKLMSFFDFSRPVSQPWSELLRIDCLISTEFLQTSGSLGPSFRLFYLKLVFLAALPLLFALLIWITFSMHQCRRRAVLRREGKLYEDVITQLPQHAATHKGQALTQRERTIIHNKGGKMLQVWMILVFIAHPNICQYMLYAFKCIDVDGDDHLKMDLEIRCWDDPTHSLFAYIVALPSLIAWGLGVPLLALWQLSRKRTELVKGPSGETKETYGFLFGGYKSEYYYWELMIGLRKVCLIVVCVFISNYGVLTQALIVLLVLVLFLVLTARKRPHLTESLFDMEALSLATAMLTVYCGLFFLADTSDSRVGVTYRDKSSDVTFSLSTTTQQFFTGSILVINVLFFLYWVYKVASELEALRGFVLRLCPSCYLWVFAGGDRDQAYLDKQRQVLMDDNEQHKDEFLRLLKAMKVMYNRGDLLLNEAVMKRLRQHFNPQKVLQIAGVVDVNDGELTRKIQEQLLKQYDLHIQHGNLTNDNTTTDRIHGNLLDEKETTPTRGAIMASLLGDQDAPDDGAGVTNEDYQRYLKVLNALKTTINQDGLSPEGGPVGGAAEGYYFDEDFYSNNDISVVDATGHLIPNGTQNSFNKPIPPAQINRNADGELLRDDGTQQYARKGSLLSNPNLMRTNNQLLLSDEFRQVRESKPPTADIHKRSKVAAVTMKRKQARNILMDETQGEEEEERVIHEETESAGHQQFLEQARARAGATGGNLLSEGKD